MAKKILISPGQKFGDWRVLGKATPSLGGKTRLKCKCECGVEKEVFQDSLLSGKSTKCKSCGVRSHTYPKPPAPGTLFGNWLVLGKAEPSTLGATRVLCRCKCGTERVVTATSLRNKSSTRCVKCNGRKERSLPFVGHYFGDWCVIQTLPTNPYTKSVVLCRCKCGTERAVLVANLKRGITQNCGCQKSFQEQLLSEFIKSITDAQIIRNDRKILVGKEIDIFLPALKIGIEYNGNYWHSTAKNPLKTTHFEKRVLAEKQGIRLIQIRSDEWLEKQEIVKSIICNALNITSNRLFARKLKIKTVESKEAQTFLVNNHLMGTYKAAQHLGLFTPENQLVQLFSYQIHSDGTLLDCSRICALCNYVVVGGVSRLLKAVLKQHPALTKVVSFVDLRYADGHSLKALGFILENTTLGWGWVSRNQWFNRRKCRADKTRDLTEKQHAALLGWSRLYDSGQAKWVLNISK